MSEEPQKFECDKRDLVSLAEAFYKLKNLFDLALSGETEHGTCALESCGKPFIKREQKQRFCCPEHQMKWNNDQRKIKKIAQAIGEAPTVKCQVQGCENIFVLDMSLPFPYRCRACAAKSV